MAIAKQAILLFVLLIVPVAVVKAKPPIRGADPKPTSLANFDAFKLLFHKHYTSAVEEVRRSWHFLASLLRVVISSIKYMSGRSDYYLAVNSLSDKSEDEVRGLFSKQPMLPEIEAEWEPVFNDGKEQIRSKRGLKGVKNEQDEVITEDMLEENEYQYHKIKSIWPELEFLPTPKYAQPTQWYNLVSLQEDKWLRIYSKSRNENRMDLIKTFDVDYSTGQCMSEPRSQGGCGCCYAFSTIALLEYLNCKEKGRLEKFSEQYIVDCGTQRKDFFILGCMGGLAERVSMLTRTIGVEYLKDYPFRGQEGSCPYDAEKNPEEMGALRPTGLESALRIPVHHMDHMIRFGPMLVSLKLPKDFYSYGGGIVDGADCSGSNVAERHTLLIVGSGQEDGHHFWLLRNSFGPNWGLSGYFKLNKLADCFNGGAAYMFATKDGRNFDLHLEPNP